MNFRIFLIMAVFLSGSLILTSCNNEEEMPMDDEHMEGQMNDEHMEDGHMQDGDHIQGAAMLTQERSLKMLPESRFPQQALLTGVKT
ncbi:MAG: hypothetical protein ACOC2K_03520 [Bacteroidota bacterium]